MAETELSPPTYLHKCCRTIHSLVKSVMQDELDFADLKEEYRHRGTGLSQKERAALRLQMFMGRQVSSAQQCPTAARACVSVHMANAELCIVTWSLHWAPVAGLRRRL